MQKKQSDAELIAEAINSLADAIRSLGFGSATMPPGPLEAIGMCLGMQPGGPSKTLPDALAEIASAIRPTESEG